MSYKKGDHIHYETLFRMGPQVGIITSVFMGVDGIQSYQVDDNWLVKDDEILCIHKQERRKL